MGLLAIPYQRAFGAQGDDGGTAYGLELFQGRFRAVGIGVAGRFGIVAEQQIHTVAKHVGQAVLEKLHHGRVGEGQ